MLTVYRRTGLIDLGGSVALALLHATMAVSYGVPGLAVVDQPQGRVSVVNYLDQFGPTWTVAFGLTAIAMAVAVTARPWWLTVVHALSMGITSIFAIAVWFGYLVSQTRPSIVTALFATAIVSWHLVLIVTYRVLGSLPQRAERRPRHRKAR